MALTVTTRIEAIQLAEPLDETDERKGFVDVAIGSMRVNSCSGQRVFESTLGALTYLWVRLLAPLSFRVSRYFHRSHSTINPTLPVQVLNNYGDDEFLNS